MKEKIIADIAAATARLDEQIEASKQFGSMVSPSPFSEAVVNYCLTGGSGHGIVKNSDIAIFLSHVKQGNDFPLHHHDSSQFMYLIEGRVDVCHGGKSIRLEAGGFYEVPAGEPHTADVLEDSICLCIHRPSEPEHPEGVIKLLPLSPRQGEGYQKNPRQESRHEETLQLLGQT